MEPARKCHGNIAHSCTDWVPSVSRVADFSGLQTRPDHNSRKCAPPPASSPLAAARNHGDRPWAVFVETKQWLPRTLPLGWWSSATLVPGQTLMSTCLHTTPQTGGCPGIPQHLMRQIHRTQHPVGHSGPHLWS